MSLRVGPVGWAFILLAGWCLWSGLLAAQPPGPQAAVSDGAPSAAPIDLPSALRLAGIQNPEILLSEQTVEEAVALRQLAAAQLLPSLNAGTSIDLHTGPLLRSNGQIIDENRGSLYLGAGAGPVGAGTVPVPGIVWSGNASAVIYANLVARQRVVQQQYFAQAVRNDVLLRVSGAYLELLRANGKVAIARKNIADATEVARVTKDWAELKAGRKADAERAATDLELRKTDLLEAEAQAAIASARLAELLNLDPAIQLHPTDLVVPRPLVADGAPLPQLLAIALTQRPELGERQAAIRAALLELEGARVLPFSPNILLGYSAGTFGGGSNRGAEGILQPDGTVLQQNRFGNFGDRQDFDAVVYWSLRNLGVGNLALIRLAKSNLRTSELRRIEVLDRIGAEVAAAYARSRARFAQIATNERAVELSTDGFQQELDRTRNFQGIPIETIDIMRLLGRSRYAYLDAIIDFNRAQFDLYVALGLPRADFLARAVPAPKTP
jgi:outer membrane protein TolC